MDNDYKRCMIIPEFKFFGLIKITPEYISRNAFGPIQVKKKIELTRRGKFFFILTFLTILSMLFMYRYDIKSYYEIVFINTKVINKLNSREEKLLTAITAIKKSKQDILQQLGQIAHDNYNEDIVDLITLENNSYYKNNNSFRNFVQVYERINNVQTKLEKYYAELIVTKSMLQVSDSMKDNDITEVQRKVSKLLIDIDSEFSQGNINSK